MIDEKEIKTLLHLVIRQGIRNFTTNAYMQTFKTLTHRLKSQMAASTTSAPCLQTPEPDK